MKWLPRGLLLMLLASGLWVGSSAERFQLAQTLCEPSRAHWLGCDAFGRDLLGLVLRGGLLSLGVAGAATLASMGLALGFSGWLAQLSPRRQVAAHRALDGLLVFPSLLLALGWAAVRGPGWDTLAFALLLGSTPSLARLLSARAGEVMREPYVAAAQGLGASKLWILRAHLIPPLLEMLRIKAPNLLAHALLGEASLSFLGVGAPIGTPTWGALLLQSRDYLLEVPRIAWTLGAVMVVTLVSLIRLSNEGILSK